MIGFLLDRGAAVDERFREERAPPPGPTPLMGAAGDGLFDAARVLTRRGAALDATDSKGYTPLLHAVGTADLGTAEMIDLLLDAGADPSTTSNDGETALALARRYGVPAVVTALERVEAESSQGTER